MAWGNGKEMNWARIFKPENFECTATALENQDD
jgi:hypothetical protein